MSIIPDVASPGHYNEGGKLQSSPKGQEGIRVSERRTLYLSNEAIINSSTI